VVRLHARNVPGLVALLGAVLISSCATATEVNESNTSQIEVSPVPESTIDFNTPEAATVPGGRADFSNTPSSVPTRSPVPLITETVAVATTQDVSRQPISPISTSAASSSENGPIPVYTYEIVNIYPHDRDAFTQGLVFEEGVLYEGTGLRGRSSLRTVELETGDVLKLHSLALPLFGEGVTVYGDKIFQLTWQAHVGFVYDKDTFELLQEFTYPTEGWGITHDGQRLIMSDGTSTLHFLDPETLEEIGQIEVYDQNGPVTRLNELEYIHGEVYANVWKTDRIARIDPQTGQVTGWIDLTGLLSAEDRVEPVDVLNGIAYDAENDRLFVTGKLWPKIFEIELTPEMTNDK
jgi:glutamine cyclotransferase